jgi:hypothetical protein
MLALRGEYHQLAQAGPTLVSASPTQADGLESPKEPKPTEFVAKHEKI